MKFNKITLTHIFRHYQIDYQYADMRSKESSELKWGILDEEDINLQTLNTENMKAEYAEYTAEICVRIKG